MPSDRAKPRKAREDMSEAVGADSLQYRERIANGTTEEARPPRPFAIVNARLVDTIVANALERHERRAKPARCLCTNVMEDCKWLAITSEPPPAF